MSDGKRLDKAVVSEVSEASGNTRGGAESTPQAATKALAPGSSGAGPGDGTGAGGPEPCPANPTASGVEEKGVTSFRPETSGVQHAPARGPEEAGTSCCEPYAAGGWHSADCLTSANAEALADLEKATQAMLENANVTFERQTNAEPGQRRAVLPPEVYDALSRDHDSYPYMRDDAQTVADGLRLDLSKYGRGEPRTETALTDPDLRKLIDEARADERAKAIEEASAIAEGASRLGEHGSAAYADGYRNAALYIAQKIKWAMTTPEKGAGGT